MLFSKRIILCCFLFIFSNFVFGKSTLTIITEDWAPLNYLENDSIKGPAVDVVRAIQNRINDMNKLIVLPWKRGYTYTLEKENQVLFSVARTAERESLFKWVGPIATNTFFLYAKKDSPIKLNTLDDAKHYSIGVQRGGITGDILRVRGFSNLQEVTSSRQNAGKLLRNRIDFMVESNATFLQTMKNFKMNKNDFKDMFVIEKLFMYIAFSKSTSDEVILKWQNAYDTLYETGLIEEIFKEHDTLEIYWEK